MPTDPYVPCYRDPIGALGGGRIPTDRTWPLARCTLERSWPLPATGPRAGVAPRGDGPRAEQKGLDLLIYAGLSSESVCSLTAKAIGF